MYLKLNATHLENSENDKEQGTCKLRNTKNGKNGKKRKETKRKKKKTVRKETKTP